MVSHVLVFGTFRLHKRVGDTNSSFAAEIEWIEIVWLRVAYGDGAYKIGTIDCPLEEHASYLRF